MRTGGLLHRGQKPTCAPHPSPPAVEVETIPVRVLAHCRACGEHVEVTGADTAQETGEWMASHWQPVIDAMDVGTVDGSYLGTWINPRARR